MRRAISALALVLVACAACVGTTGGDVVDFPAAAAGPRDVALGRLELVNDRGWHVVLTKAMLHVGAVYLSQSEPVSGAQATACILPGTYVAQVTTGLDVDLLSPTPQPFPSLGHGTTLAAIVGQVWLTGGAVDDVADPTPILQLAGTADRAGDVRAFDGQVTISSNRQQETGAVAGSSTICKQRIVTPIETNVVIQHVGGLVVRIDPRLLFVNVDFGALDPSKTGYAFSDDPTQIDPKSPLYYSQPSVNLYQNLHATGRLYSFEWDEALRP